MRKLTTVFGLVACWLFVNISSAQDLQLEQGAVGSFLRLKELQTSASVLHVVAHPDDEDGAMLAYCARGLGARTMLFSLTRGEGGANLISSHFFDELGALRTLEHLKAASYYGIELFYSRAADYGFSKTLEEAMRQWQNGIPLLEDLVEVIRRERPTVLLSRFAGDPRDGHGHHQMAGVLSRLAFDAAADPSRFPKQLERGLRPWQVKKLYVRAGSPWRQPKEGDWTIALPTGTYDSVIGRSYAEVARFGLGFQRSQGISGHDGTPGPASSYYRLAKRADGGSLDGQESSLFDGLDQSYSGLAGDSPESLKLRRIMATVERELAKSMSGWNPQDPKPTLERLTKQLSILQAMSTSRDALPESESDFADAMRRLERKLEKAIVTLAGLRLDAWVEFDSGAEINHAVDEKLDFRVRLANQGPLNATWQSATLHRADGNADQRVPEEQDAATGSVIETTISEKVEQLPTKPHWNRDTIAASTYQIYADGRQRPAPLSPYWIQATVSLNGVDVPSSAVVRTRLRHPDFGRVSYPLTIAPAYSVRFPMQSRIVRTDQRTYMLPVVVRGSRKEESQASVGLQVPPGWNSNPAKHSVAFAREDEEVTVEFEVQVPSNATQKEYRIHAFVEAAGVVFREGFETVTARDLGRMNIYREAVHHVQVADAQLAGNPRVGYVRGSGDKVAESLAVFGISPVFLSETDLAGGDLSQFDVILVGVRAYAVREDIRVHNSRLLAYVKQGGTLIVQYQTPEFDQNFGPYPYQMGRRPEEVSEEDARVTILEPTHPIFNVPNKITSQDFDGWLEQRGSKFWTSWDPNYVPLLECHDTGQPKQNGGMLIAKYGQGHYVYSAYAWYRQLPQGVPGAYRIFANMLSLPKTGSNE